MAMAYTLQLVWGPVPLRYEGIPTRDTTARPFAMRFQPVGVALVWLQLVCLRSTLAVRPLQASMHTTH